MSGANPSHFTGNDQRPVEMVSWNVITGSGGFLSILNAANPGMNFRLPSEAEWEYACRARTTTRFYWGDDLTYTAIANYAWQNETSSSTHPVGGKSPNIWGLYDMSGNVYEWVQDWFHGDYTNALMNGSAWESPAGSSRVQRGGCWNGGNYGCRSANRAFSPPDATGESVGFRLAKF
jgi:formylglycine-generating enzyme required for sulfatase activity